MVAVEEKEELQFQMCMSSVLPYSFTGGQPVQKRCEDIATTKDMQCLELRGLWICMKLNVAVWLAASANMF